MKANSGSVWLWCLWHSLRWRHCCGCKGWNSWNPPGTTETLNMSQTWNKLFSPLTLTSGATGDTFSSGNEERGKNYRAGERQPDMEKERECQRDRDPVGWQSARGCVRTCVPWVQRWLRSTDKSHPLFWGGARKPLSGFQWHSSLPQRHIFLVPQGVRALASLTFLHLLLYPVVPVRLPLSR